MCKLKTSIALRNTSFEVIDRMKRARNDRDPSHTFATTNRKRKKNKKRKRKTESINEKKKNSFYSGMCFYLRPTRDHWITVLPLFPKIDTFCVT